MGSKIRQQQYHPFQQPTFLTIPQQQPFPYTSPFIHSTKDGNGLDQHWSIAQPGPLGWVVGRVGMGRNLEGLYKTIKVCLLDPVKSLLRNVEADGSSTGFEKAARPESDVCQCLQV